MTDVWVTGFERFADDELNQALTFEVKTGQLGFAFDTAW
jgi:hypothetical protein